MVKRHREWVEISPMGCPGEFISIRSQCTSKLIIGLMLQFPPISTRLPNTAETFTANLTSIILGLSVFHLSSSEQAELGALFSASTDFVVYSARSFASYFSNPSARGVITLTEISGMFQHIGKMTRRIAAWLVLQKLAVAFE